MERALRVPAHGNLSSAIAHDAALSRLELVSRANLGRHEIFRKILDRGDVLIDEVHHGRDRLAGGLIDLLPFTGPVDDEVLQKDAGQGAMGYALSRISRDAEWTLPPGCAV